MKYTANKVEYQQLMFHIKMEHNGKDLTFNVVCAESESEVPELIEVYLHTLDNPPVIQSQPTPQIDPMAVIKEQQAIIESLTARVVALESN